MDCENKSDEESVLVGNKINPRKIKSVQRESVVKIEKFANDGVAIAYDENSKLIFVRYALPGELLKVKIYKETSEYGMAEPIEILEKSPQRIIPACKYFSICGGCDYQMMDYSEQIRVKKELVLDSFRYIGKIENIKITDVLSGANVFNYRNTETFKVGMKKNKSIGFFRKDTKFVVDIDECKIAMDGINQALIDTRSSDYPGHNFKVRSTIDGDTVINWIKSEKYQDREVYERVDTAGISLKFKISKDSFFQVNDSVIPLWLEKIISFLDKNKNERVFDLYCGIGLITLFVSFFAKETIGIEISKSSIKDANHNIEINNINTVVKFIESPVEDIVDTLGSADVVIIDPPRKGTDKKTIDTILKINPKKIIYSSCKPQTMARDIKDFGSNYVIKDFVLVDMFPQTHHVEMLALLERI